MSRFCLKPKSDKRNVQYHVSEPSSTKIDSSTFCIFIVYYTVGSSFFLQTKTVFECKLTT